MSLRDKIARPKQETVTIGDEVLTVRGLTLRQRIALEDIVKPDDPASKLELAIRLLIDCVQRADGTPAFTAQDADWLRAEADGLELSRLFAAAARLSGLTRGDGDGLSPEKNSPAALVGASSTGSAGAPANGT